MHRGAGLRPSRSQWPDLNLFNSYVSTNATEGDSSHGGGIYHRNGGCEFLSIPTFEIPRRRGSRCRRAWGLNLMQSELQHEIRALVDGQLGVLDNARGGGVALCGSAITSYNKVAIRRKNQSGRVVVEV